MTATRHRDSPEHEAKRFLGWLAALAVTAEAAFALVLPLDRGRHEVDRLARQTSAGELEGEVVLLADSVAYAVLTPAAARANGVADLASNREIGAAGNAFLLERLTRSNAEPLRAVVYVAAPTSLEVDLEPSRYRLPYFTSVFLRDAEIRDVEERLDRPALAARMRAERRALTWRFPSHMRAGLALHPLDAALRRAKHVLNAALGDEPPELTPDARRDLEALAARRCLRISRVTEVYLDRLAELSVNAGAVLVLTPPPLAPSVRRAWRANGVLERYEHFLADFAARHRGVVFEPVCPYQPDDDRVFVDGVHLTPQGKAEWAAELVPWLDEVGRSGN
jgi:hypothetical protein